MSLHKYRHYESFPLLLYLQYQCRWKGGQFMYSVRRTYFSCSFDFGESPHLKLMSFPLLLFYCFIIYYFYTFENTQVWLLVLFSPVKHVKSDYFSSLKASVKEAKTGTWQPNLTDSFPKWRTIPASHTETKRHLEIDLAQFAQAAQGWDVISWNCAPLKETR
ncbi:hypothetical protein RvY_00428 [Ramazzottius varieornatus]|uniref:Uncharacterized protein n=1 Tax=Ramazzottius varieornatus TaxID=947166 RepID=A0A1D1UCQ6_RAMVA|nr:hypothetical protein RvY_00428 [Ramazzottius varieornatus]